eukprot:2683949-Pyramimonas_sp.AAC.1
MAARSREGGLLSALARPATASGSTATSICRCLPGFTAGSGRAWSSQCAWRLQLLASNSGGLTDATAC